MAVFIHDTHSAADACAPRGKSTKLYPIKTSSGSESLIRNDGRNVLAVFPSNALKFVKASWVSVCHQLRLVDEADSF